MQTKPSIVFVHGLWADGSCFSKVIPPLQAEGYEVMASQHSLDSVKGDVATVTRTLGRVSSHDRAGQQPRPDALQPETRARCDPQGRACRSEVRGCSERIASRVAKLRIDDADD